MSNWLTLEITINKNSKCSINKAVEHIWGNDEVFVTKDEDSYKLPYDLFHVGICEGSGVSELVRLKQFVEYIKDFDKHINVEVIVKNLVLY